MEPPASSSLSSVKDEQSSPDQIRYALEQNYPNPFNPATTIRFSIPAGQRVILWVLNVLGQEVDTLVGGDRAAGTHEVVWSAGILAGGVYFYRLEGGSRTEGRAMILSR